MTEEEDGWTKSLIISGLIAPVVGALVSPLVEKLLANLGISFGWLSWMSGVVVSLLTASVEVWHVLVSYAIFAVIGYAWAKLWITPKRQPDPYEIMRSYKSAEIFGVIWTWDWNRTEFIPDEPFALCPNCDWQLGLEEVYDSSPKTSEGSSVLRRPTGTKVECERCEFTHEWDRPPEELKEFIQKEILRRVRAGEYEILT